MTCNKCDDIHVSQRDGKQLESCKCECHNDIIIDLTYTPYCPPNPCCPTFTQPWYTVTTTTGGTNNNVL